MEVSPKDYFKVDLQEQLPGAEIKRRQATKRNLESHFEQWQRDEQHCRYSTAHLSAKPSEIMS